MSALTSYVSRWPRSSAPVIAYRQKNATCSWESWRSELSAVGYKPGTALTTALQSVGLRKDLLLDYQPRTELGKRLLALRQAYVARGGELLSADALDEELRSRRGGIGDVEAHLHRYFPADSGL